MTPRLNVLAATVFTACLALQTAPEAQTNRPLVKSFTPPLSVVREQIRPSVETLRVPVGFTSEQMVLGDRVFHGEAAGGRCSTCHGADAKGTAIGSDLTTGMYIWADGSVNGIKRVLVHNMSVAPTMDGNLSPADVDAVAAYVWALGRQNE